MPTKDELIDENATLRARVAELEKQLEKAAWVEGAGLQVLPDLHENGDVKGWLLCTAEGLPVDGVIVDGAFVTSEVDKADEPSVALGWVHALDTDGNSLESGALYEFSNEGNPQFVKVDSVSEDVAKATAGEGDGEATWLYREGEGFTRVSDGLTIGLDKWYVDEGNGAKGEPKEGLLYRYVGGTVLVAVTPGELSGDALVVEQLQHDKLTLATQLDEKRDEVAALTKRLNAGATLHGAIDDLPPVV